MPGELEPKKYEELSPEEQLLYLERGFREQASRSLYLEEHRFFRRGSKEFEENLKNFSQIVVEDDMVNEIKERYIEYRMRSYEKEPTIGGYFYYHYTLDPRAWSHPISEGSFTDLGVREQIGILEAAYQKRPGSDKKKAAPAFQDCIEKARSSYALNALEKKHFQPREEIQLLYNHYRDEGGRGYESPNMLSWIKYQKDQFVNFSPYAQCGVLEALYRDQRNHDGLTYVKNPEMDSIVNYVDFVIKIDSNRYNIDNLYVSEELLEAQRLYAQYRNSGPGKENPSFEGWTHFKEGREYSRPMPEGVAKEEDWRTVAELEAAKRKEEKKNKFDDLAPELKLAYFELIFRHHVRDYLGSDIPYNIKCSAAFEQKLSLSEKVLKDTGILDDEDIHNDPDIMKRQQLYGEYRMQDYVQDPSLSDFNRYQKEIQSREEKRKRFVERVAPELSEPLQEYIVFKEAFEARFKAEHGRDFDFGRDEKALKTAWERHVKGESEEEAKAAEKEKMKQWKKEFRKRMREQKGKGKEPVGGREKQESASKGKKLEDTRKYFERLSPEGKVGVLEYEYQKSVKDSDKQSHERMERYVRRVKRFVRNVPNCVPEGLLTEYTKYRHGNNDPSLKGWEEYRQENMPELGNNSHASKVQKRENFRARSRGGTSDSGKPPRGS